MCLGDRGPLLQTLAHISNEELYAGLHIGPVESLSGQTNHFIRAQMTHFLIKLLIHQSMIFLWK